MNIILCDDERNFAEALREEIKNFFDNKSMQVNITWYGSGEELLKAFEGEKSDVDVYKRQRLCRVAIILSHR